MNPEIYFYFHNETHSDTIEGLATQVVVMRREDSTSVIQEERYAKIHDKQRGLPIP